MRRKSSFLLIVMFLMAFLFFQLFAMLSIVKIARGASQTPSGKTAATLITDARYYLNEPTARFWLDAELLRHINDAITNIVARTNCLEASEGFVITTGTSEYALTSSYVAIKSVTYQSAVTEFKSLLKGDVTEVGRIEGDYEEPEYWYEHNGKVGIYPLKDSDVSITSGNTIYVLFTPMQSTIISTSTIPTPASFDRAILYYTVAQALLKNQQFQLANNYMTQFYTELDRFRFDIIDKPKESIWEVTLPEMSFPAKEPPQ